MLLASEDGAMAAGGPPLSAPPVDLFLAYRDPAARERAFRLVAEARRAGLRAQLELAGRSLKGQLKQADRVGARYVAILEDGGAALKDMESGEQREIEPGAIAAEVLRGRGL
jgi:histidyl-tRNA synthetase